ncbi:MAG: TlyA family RNA methyltransferase [Dehalococcoidales bacterium]
MTRQRIDNLIVARGLTQSRAKAQALIMAGKVIVAGKDALKPGTLVSQEVDIRVSEPPLFVSRGGIKLADALDRFQLDVANWTVTDIGASTGGFTDCLLQRGARRVYAVDVGYGQLDYRLRQDERVVIMERVNARYPMALPEKVDLVTMDLSFISVQKVLPAVVHLLKDGGSILVLIKPQFEAKRKEVGKGGVIQSPLLHAQILGRFLNWVTAQNYRLKGLVASPILGSAGNKEFFARLKLT